MGETPGEIRRDIEETRRQMGATLDALGYRMDVRARMRHGLGGAGQRLATMTAGMRQGMTDVKERAMRTMQERGTSGEVPEAMNAPESMTGEDPPAGRERGDRPIVGSFIRKNVWVIAAGAFVATLVAGMLVPRTRTEMRKLGPATSRLTHKAVQAGQHAMHMGGEQNDEQQEG